MSMIDHDDIERLNRNARERAADVRCRCPDGHMPGHSHNKPTNTDPMAAPYVAATVAAFGGSVRLTSASGGMEALWIRLRDDAGDDVIFNRATGRHMQPAVRLTPSDARVLAEHLLRYANAHKDTP